MNTGEAHRRSGLAGLGRKNKKAVLAVLLLVLTIVLVLGLATVAMATVQLEGTVSVTTSNANTNTVSVTHTTGTGDGRLLLVGVSWNPSSAATISSIVFTPTGEDAISLTEIKTQQAATSYRYAAIYGLLDAPNNKAGMVTVTFSRSFTTGVILGAANFAGVDLTTALASWIDNGAGLASGNAPSVTLTGLGGDELVVDTVFIGGNPAPDLTVGDNQIQLPGWNSKIGNAGGAASYEQAGGNTSVTMGWSASASGPWAIAAVAIPAGTDITSPTVTINQASGQADPTSTAPVNFTVVFSETVTGFTNEDVILSGTAGATTATVTGSGATYNVAVSGMTQSGTVIASIPADVAQDGAGNLNYASSSTDNTVTFDYDTTSPTVTINQASGQADPTSVSPVNFTVVFSEPVTGFETGDVNLSASTVPGALAAVVTGSGTTYNVAVSGMSGSGNIVAGVNAGMAHDGAGNPNDASSSTDNTVGYNYAGPPPLYAPVSVTTADDVKTVNLNHTTGTGTDRLMLVGVSWNSDTAGRTIESVTFTPDGSETALPLNSEVTQKHGSNYRYAAIYSLIDPPSGVSGVVTVTFVEGTVTAGVVVGAANFAGVDQTDPIGVVGGAYSPSNNTTPTVTLEGLTGDELVFDTAFLGGNPPAVLNVGEGQTQLTGWNVNIANCRGAASTEPAGDNTSVTMSWTAAADSMWVVVAAAIRPAEGNSAPTDIGLSNATIAENAGTDAAIGSLSGTDPNAGDILTFSLPVGVDDNIHFNIAPDGTTLRAADSFDYETANSYTVTVRATDEGGLFYDEQFTITVTNVNEAPVVSDIPGQTIAEGQAFTTINLDGYVSDPDNSDAEIAWTYDGNSDLTVNIVDRVATISIPDAGWHGAETITFRATDLGSLWDEDSATFTVNDETPPMFTLGGLNAALNGGAPYALGFVSLTNTATLSTNRVSVDDYTLFFSGQSVSEPLKSQMFGLYLTGLTGVTAAQLEAYYTARGVPEPYFSRLIAAANGTQPFAYIDGATLVLCDGAHWAVAGSKTAMIVPGDFPLGSYTVSGQIQDEAGNGATVTFTLVVTDGAPPTGTVEINGDATYTASQTVALTLTADADTTEMRFSNDQTTWSSWEAYAAGKNWTLSSGDGLKSVYVQLKDAAGNISTEVITDSITLDTTGPVVTITSPVHGSTVTDNTPTLTYDAGDAASVVVKVDNVIVSKVSGDTLDELGDGEHTVTVTGTDALGNPTTDTSTFTVDTGLLPHTITLVYTGPENPVGGVDNMSVTATVLDEYGNPVGGIDLGFVFAAQPGSVGIIDGMRGTNLFTNVTGQAVFDWGESLGEYGVTQVYVFWDENDNALEDSEETLKSELVTITILSSSPQVNVTYKVGWNLVAGGPGSDFSDLTLYRYNGSMYIPMGSDTMTHGAGYWLYLEEELAASLQVTSPPVSCSLQIGWNLIGNSTAVPLVLPEGYTCLTYDTTKGIYVPTNQLQPGQGAWIYSETVGSIQLVTAGS